MAKKFLTIKQAEARLREGWLLQFCSASRGDGWAWVRRKPGDPYPEHVRWNAADSLRRRLSLKQTDDEKYSDFYYRLVDDTNDREHSNR